jgi:hypothetical protein
MRLPLRCGGTRASRIRARRTPTKGVPQRIYPDREGQEMWKTLDAASREAKRAAREARKAAIHAYLAEHLTSSQQCHTGYPWLKSFCPDSPGYWR